MRNPLVTRAIRRLLRATPSQLHVAQIIGHFGQPAKWGCDPASTQQEAT